MNQNKLLQNSLGYWEVADKPTEIELQAYYSKKYYQELKGANQRVYNEQELTFYRTKVTQKMAMIERHFSLPAGVKHSYLDVGCGEGFELSCFLEQGWQVKGIDFSKDGMQQHNPHCLPYLEVGNIYELLEREIAAKNQYHIVWLQNVLEHVIDPQALLRRLLPLIAPGGGAVVLVPNDFSALQKMLLETQKVSTPYWVALPDHLSYFDAQSLRKTAENNCWECCATMADFPIDWFLANKNSNYIEDKTVGKTAHYARLALENLIYQQPMAQQLDFWCALADIGMGRSLTAFLKPNIVAEGDCSVELKR